MQDPFGQIVLLRLWLFKLMETKTLKVQRLEMQQGTHTVGECSSLWSCRLLSGSRCASAARGGAGYAPCHTYALQEENRKGRGMKKKSKSPKIYTKPRQNHQKLQNCIENTNLCPQSAFFLQVIDIHF